MKAKKFGLFASIKNIEQNISTYRTIIDTVNSRGIAMYNPNFIENFSNDSLKLNVNKISIVEGTQKQIRSIDFVIAYFTEKSRTVFFQSILALENKLPVLCVISEEKYVDFPETLLAYGEQFITVRKYTNNIDLQKIINEYIDELEPPKKRFNVVLKSHTMTKMEQLSTNLQISKAELIRKLVDKEFKRLFGN